MAIVIHGDVAVAHYLYTSAFENKDGEVEVNNGRYSDILIHTQDGWKFLSWHGGDDD
jgi:ketosteroid isomerase-like protein